PLNDLERENATPPAVGRTGGPRGELGTPDGCRVSGFVPRGMPVVPPQSAPKENRMPTKMEEPRELFLHELGDLLYAENLLIKELPKLAQEASDEELSGAFEAHREETKQHAANLEQVFELIGEQPKAEQCPGIDGIKTEHDEFIKQQRPSPEVCDLFLTGAGARAEHYEIAAYTGLITMAQAMGESDAVVLLQENLKQEKAALEKLERAATRLSREHVTA
ncbi:MAG: hypothetical protein QOE87_363, partial [Gaiellales bacterium]|nr:hypothetical protein [Gaiellales bacterium]